MANTIYRIWGKVCGKDKVIYIGRTKQPLQNRLRGHFFGHPMHRKVDVSEVTRVDYAEFETVANMYVVEVLLINIYKPILNHDDKSLDEMTLPITLDIDWREWVNDKLANKWRKKLAIIDGADMDGNMS